jgi:hypothetical protein
VNKLDKKEKKLFGKGLILCMLGGLFAWACKVNDIHKVIAYSGQAIILFTGIYVILIRPYSKATAAAEKINTDGRCRWCGKILTRKDEEIITGARHWHYVCFIKLQRMKCKKGAVILPPLAILMLTILLYNSTNDIIYKVVASAWFMGLSLLPLLMFFSYGRMITRLESEKSEIKGA